MMSKDDMEYLSEIVLQVSHSHFTTADMYWNSVIVIVAVN